MKKNLTKWLAVSGVALFLLPACKKSGTEVTSNGGKAGTLTANVTTLPLSKALVSDTTTVIDFRFTKANYGFSASVTNTLQIDVPGDNWKNPTSATLEQNVYSQGFSTGTFNNLVLKLNVPAGVATPIVARIMQSVSSEVAPIYSNTLDLNVTAFNLTSWVYVPGAYQGWTFTNNAEDSLVSVTGNGVYVGVINFTAGNNQFLITPAANYVNKYATNAPAVNPPGTSVTYSVAYNGPNNFYAPVTAGYYLVTFNSNTNSVSIVPADNYSVIGNAALGWNAGNDINMKFINDGTNTWLGANIAMSVELPPNNGFKIREDDAWMYSWGTSGTAGILTDASTAVNIGISTAGNYNVTFIMAPTPLATTPVETGAYTVTKLP